MPRKNRVLHPVVVVALLLGVGCGDRCSEPPPPTGVEGAHALATMIPGDAQAVAFSDDLGELVERIDRFVGELPLDLEGPPPVEQWSKVGAKVDGPGAAFWTGDQWALAGWVQPEREVALNEWSATGTARDWEREGDEQGRFWVEGDGRWTQWVATDGRRIAAGWSLAEGARRLDNSIWTLEEGEHWTVGRRQRLHGGGTVAGDGRRTSGEDPLYGAIDGAQLMRSFDVEGHAGVVWSQLADDLGIIYWSLIERDDGRWTLALDTSGGGPEGGRDLGEAREKLPSLGGLLRPGSPGVLRLSAEPERAVELFRDNLDTSQRAQFDMMLQVLAEQFSLDLIEDAIANVTGQVAIVVLGFEDHFFELDGMERLASLIRLDSTRGAVVVPFEDREAMEMVLNAFTQLTKGKLRRQATERTIQYARFDDGILKWAAILADEHLIIVDSAVAFDYVGDWERSPSPLDEIFVERGVDEMLGEKRGLGLYVDVATVRSLVREGGDEELVAWLEPLEAIRVVSDVDGQPERTEIDLWPVRRAEAEEE